jgi:acyl-CoA hydrolase
MSRVFFKAPVHVGDVVECRTEVVHATRHTVHVHTHVRLFRHRAAPVGSGGVTDKSITLDDSHSGTFVCLCIDGDERGGKRPVGRRLVVSTDDSAAAALGGGSSGSGGGSTSISGEGYGDDYDNDEEEGEADVGTEEAERRRLLRHLDARQAHSSFMKVNFHKH